MKPPTRLHKFKVWMFDCADRVLLTINKFFFFQNTLMVNIELAQKLEKQIMTVLNTAIIGK